MTVNDLIRIVELLFPRNFDSIAPSFSIKQNNFRDASTKRRFYKEFTLNRIASLWCLKQVHILLGECVERLPFSGE